MPDAPVPSRIEAMDSGGYSLAEQQHAQDYDPPPTGPWRFRLRTLMIFTAVIAIALWGITSGSHWSRQAGIANQITNGLHVLGLSINNYAYSRGTLPPPHRADEQGNPLSSWRFQILPYIEKSGYPHDLKAAWDSPQNARLAAAPINLMSWPEAGLTTNIFAVTGSGTAFDPARAVRLQDLPSYLVVLMEVADSKTHWMQPGDYDVTKLLAATGRLGDTVKGVLKDRVHVLFADGEVWALSPDMPIDALKPFLTITAAKAADREKQLAIYRVD